MPIIGVVGGIGSGKSFIARIFAERGCIVSDSDALAHQALRDPAIHRALVARFGTAILDPDGAIDRRALGHVVFSDSSARRELEALVHPWIHTRREQHFRTATASTPACVIDAPLLLEAGLDARCDAVVFVDAPVHVRLARVAARGWDEADFRRREAAQWPLDEKRRRATFVIENGDGTDERAARAAVEEVLRALR